jgi:hypothetical protein
MSYFIGHRDSEQHQAGLAKSPTATMVESATLIPLSLSTLAQFAEPMAAILADRREFACPSSTFTAF